MKISQWNCNGEAYDAKERINCSSAIVNIKSGVQRSFCFRVPVEAARAQGDNGVVDE